MATSTILDTLATAATTTIAATAKPTSGAPAPHEGKNGECRLLGPFALFVQAALGALALLSLVYKRWRERPQRPLKIWFFDASKQVFGSGLLHVANVVMSMLTSGRFNVKPKAMGVVHAMLTRAEGYTPNPCSSYLLNLAIDTTIGIPILLGLLKVIHGLASYTSYGQPPESIQSGYYGNPPSALWWLKQSILYFFGLMGMKLCVLVIFLVLPWIDKVGDWALGWTAGNEKVQIAFVMMIFPLIMNAMQYYIIDSFIKKKEMDHDRLSTTDDFGHGRSPFSEDEDFAAELMTGLDSESEDEAPKKPAAKPKAQEEYDPSRDGESQTMAGSSRTQQSYGSNKATGQSSVASRERDD